MGHHLQYFYSIVKLSSNFEDGLNEESLGLKRFLKHKNWVKISDINARESEYTILRFINNDSKKCYFKLYYFSKVAFFE